MLLFDFSRPALLCGRTLTLDLSGVCVCSRERSTCQTRRAVAWSEKQSPHRTGNPCARWPQLLGLNCSESKLTQRLLVYFFCGIHAVGERSLMLMFCLASHTTHTHTQQNTGRVFFLSTRLSPRPSCCFTQLASSHPHTQSCIDSIAYWKPQRR